jgi:uncharacterized protein
MGNAPYDRLAAVLRPLGRVAVALSGGVDSSVLVAAAARVLGPDAVLAVTFRAPVVPESDEKDATVAVQAAGVRHVLLHADEGFLDQPHFRDNPVDRCYHCKTSIFTRVLAAAAAEGFSTVVDGTNLDDLGEYRPGLAALKELGVRSPLAEAGLAKADVRSLARDFGLSIADKPPMACLATRIPHGTPITAEAMRRIDRAETALRALGEGLVRVRDREGVARIELSPERIARGITGAEAKAFADAVRSAGFTRATLDLEGYRTSGGPAS